METNSTKYQVRLSLIAGLIAAFFWIIADILLVGFVPHPEKYPLISETLSSRILDPDFALLMLDGSPSRLKWGVLLATFTIFLTLISVYGVYKLIKPGKLAKAFAIFLFIGASLAPLGHAGFFYVGIQAKSLISSSAENLDMQIENFNLFYNVLIIHWASSIFLSSIGWMVFLWACIRGQTVLPKKAAFLNPFVLSILVALICSRFDKTMIGAMIGGASLNVGLLIFFIGVLWITGLKKKGNTE